MAGLTQPVTIAGGGLAGLSLGIALLRRGVEVTLHEAGSYPRHRVCGEFISGVTPATLAHLGIPDCLAGATAITRSRWFDASGEILRVPVSGSGLSRWTLDQRLQDEFSKSGGTLVVRSRIASGPGIVWAGGRVRTGGKWIGLKCHVRDLALADGLEMHIGSNGYVGLARVEDGVVNVCGLFRAESGIGGRDALFQCLNRGGLSGLAERISRADPDSFCAVAGFRTGRQSGPPGAIGDAAFMIPPFTGNGMSMAIESAECALDPLLEFAAGTATWDQASSQIARRQNERFSRRMRVAGTVHAFLTARPALVAAVARRRLLPVTWMLRLLRV